MQPAQNEGDFQNGNIKRLLEFFTVVVKQLNMHFASIWEENEENNILGL